MPLHVIVSLAVKRSGLFGPWEQGLPLTDSFWGTELYLLYVDELAEYIKPIKGILY